MNQKPQKDFSVRYDQSAITYITQFLASPGNEELLLDLSSGLLNDGTRSKTLPIQSRVAMPWSTVERLSSVLNQIVAARHQQLEGQRQTQNCSQPSASVPQAAVVPQATLPQMSASQ